jgi:hypothetical protein
MAKKKKAKKRKKLEVEKTVIERGDPRIVPDYSRGCINCGDKPIVPMTRMCGPCTWGEASTANGNW